MEVGEEKMYEASVRNREGEDSGREGKSLRKEGRVHQGREG